MRNWKLKIQRKIFFPNVLFARKKTPSSLSCVHPLFHSPLTNFSPPLFFPYTLLSFTTPISFRFPFPHIFTTNKLLINTPTLNLHSLLLPPPLQPLSQIYLLCSPSFPSSLLFSYFALFTSYFTRSLILPILSSLTLPAFSIPPHLRKLQSCSIS